MRSIEGAIQGPIRVEHDKIIDGDTYARIYTTEHVGGYRAKTAVHAMDFSHRIGGARFVKVQGEQTQLEDGQELHVAHLAIAMTRKNAAAGLPADGQKSVIICPEAIPAEAVRIRVLTDHIRAVVEQDAGVIFGPDMANGEPILDEISRAPEEREHVTGLSTSHGGLGIDTNGYTAYGLGVAARTACSVLGIHPGRASVQGSGAVGMHMLTELSAAGIPVIAVNNRLGTLLTHAQPGLDIPSLVEILRRCGDDGLRLYAVRDKSAQFEPRSEALFEVPADVFVPAAGPKVFALERDLSAVRGENPDVRSVERWFNDTAPKLILQGANHPLSADAESWLHERGVVNLPDFIVNCGGLIGCLLEWAWRDELLHDPAARPRVDAIARRFITWVVENNVRTLLSATQSPRIAANSIAEESRCKILDRWGRQSGRDGRARVRSYLETVLAFA